MASTLLQLAKYGHQLDSILNRYKAALYPQRFRDYHRWLEQQNSAIPDNQPVVVFDFRDSRIDGPQGRRFYCLFIFFIRAGFYPVLRENYFFLGNIQDKYKKYCLQEKFSVLHKRQSLPDNYILVTDKWYSRLCHGATQIISVNYQADYSPESNCFPMPFPMFPPVYAHQQDLQLTSYRQQARPWNIFFGGDAEPDKYNKNSIRDIYAKLSRTHILETLRNSMKSNIKDDMKRRKPGHNNIYRELHSNADLDKALQENIHGLVVMNTRQCKVEPINWLGTLANSNFFLACPGVRYPMSHNLIEALAVGSIPITQYPEMFFPALEDGKNCLVFNNEAELLEKVYQAMTMPTEQLSSMRHAAQQYYDTFLNPHACIKHLLAHHPHKISLRLLPFLKAGGGFA